MEENSPAASDTAAPPEPPQQPTATEVVAARVRQLRRARNWSADRLADELAQYGVQWNRALISKLERGRRESVTVVELIALSKAFGVVPMALLPGAETWDVIRRLVFDLLVDKAASVEPDYDLVSQALNPALALGVITPEEGEAITRVYKATAPRRKAAYDELQKS